MKKNKTIKRLKLNKEFISTLNESNMELVNGAGGPRMDSGCTCIWTTARPTQETYGIRCVSEIVFPKIPMGDKLTG